ncbi:MAG TPA: hypothetical protein VJO12_15150 [Stellaceae bacterium]|nr:hypothetical protein [Stellaceae bacterium]
MSINIQWGTAGQATLRPRPGSDQQIDFASSAGDALWLAFGAAVFSPGAILARTPTWRWVVGGIVVLLATAALRRAFWREGLSLDLMQRRYRYSHGYWPNLATDEGSLDALKGVALDVVARSGSRGGEVITWVVSLVLSDRTLAVASFATELAGYEYAGVLAKRLRVPELDHTGRSEAQTAWTEIDKPLAAQAGRPAPRRQLPPLPDGSRIALFGEPLERRIVLPRAGFRPAYFVYALFPLFPPWFTGTLHDLHRGGPFVAIAGLFALGAVIICIAGKEITESGDGIAVATRLFGTRWAKRSIAKRDIVEVKLKPVPSQAWRKRDEVQLRATGALVNLTAASLSRDERAWLVQALQVMATTT